MKYYPLEEVNDRYFGKVGTPERDAMEAQLQEELKACQLGEALKDERKKRNLTQRQLGELMGVGRSQVSMIECGRTRNYSAIARAFKAMGISSSFSFGNFWLTL